MRVRLFNLAYMYDCSRLTLAIQEWRLDEVFLLESSVNRKQDTYRQVFVLRDVEEFNTCQIAQNLNLRVLSDVRMHPQFQA